jgi:hypothetical protein
MMLRPWVLQTDEWQKVQEVCDAGFRSPEKTMKIVRAHESQGWLFEVWTG